MITNERSNKTQIKQRPEVYGNLGPSASTIFNEPFRGSFGFQ